MWEETPIGDFSFDVKEKVAFQMALQLCLRFCLIYIQAGERSVKRQTTVQALQSVQTRSSIV